MSAYSIYLNKTVQMIVNDLEPKATGHPSSQRCQFHEMIYRFCNSWYVHLKKQWWSYDPRVCDSWRSGTKPSHSILMVLWHYICIKHHWVQFKKTHNLFTFCYKMITNQYTGHRYKTLNRQTNHRQEEPWVPWGVMASASSTVRHP